MTAKTKDYVAIAKRYAEEVVSGAIPACEWTTKACQRQLDDLEKAKSKEFSYRFDKAKACRICRFIEMLPHIKGEWAKYGSRIELQPWQAVILPTVSAGCRGKQGCGGSGSVYAQQRHAGWLESTRARLSRPTSGTNIIEISFS